MSLPLWWALLLAGAPDDARDAMREGTLDEARERVTLFVLGGGSWTPSGYGIGPGYGDGIGIGYGAGYGAGYYNGGGEGNGLDTGDGYGAGAVCAGYGDGDGDGSGGLGYGGDGGTGILEVTHGGRTWTPQQVLEALLEATG